MAGFKTKPTDRTAKSKTSAGTGSGPRRAASKVGGRNTATPKPPVKSGAPSGAAGSGGADLRAEPHLGPPRKRRTRAGKAGNGRNAGGRSGGRGRSRRGGRGRSLWLRLLSWTAVAGIWLAIVTGGVVAYYAYDLPDVSAVRSSVRRPTLNLVSADGSVFQRLGETQGDLIMVDALPPHLVEAVLAIEDRRYFSHFGIDPIGLARALVTNLRAGRMVQGGSTITQQLAKNLFLEPDRTIKRKVQEALLALWLEQTYTKKDILTAYLNRVYLGAGTYGVEAAARTYFGKSARHVNLWEAAVLAGLLKAPSRYSPRSSPDAAAARADVVLAAMVDAGYLTEAAADQARALPPRPRRKPGAGGNGRYFADWVVDHVAERIGLESGDLTIVTTLDPQIQNEAERRIAAALSRHGRSERVGQAAFVLMSPDGAVRAMVGGRDYGQSQYNRATMAHRQPGSAFKPFIYLAGLRNGLTPDSPVRDGPIAIDGWRPSNFDGEYRGQITLREAFARSLNTVAVRILRDAGVGAAQRAAMTVGIESPLGDDLSLALGTSEVTLLELTAAYAAFANGGRPVTSYGIAEIRDDRGRSLYRRRGRPAAPVIEQPALAHLLSLMRATVVWGTGKAAALDRPTAGKTGTSQDFRDAWFVGFTADFVAGLWLGNDDNGPMKRVTGGGLPARVWHDIMETAHEGRRVKPLPGLQPPRAPVVEARGAAAADFVLQDPTLDGGRDADRPKDLDDLIRRLMAEE